MPHSYWARETSLTHKTCGHLYVFWPTDIHTIQEINCYKDVIISGYKEAPNTVYYVTTGVRVMLVGNSGSG